MLRLSTLALAALLALPAADASAQQPNTTVSRVTLYRVLPAQRAVFDKDMRENLIPVWEAEKKAGVIVDYAVFTKNVRDSENDWNVGVNITYANWATLDGLQARIGPITLRHYGSAERRTSMGDARNAMRVVVSSTWLNPYNPNPNP